MLCIITSFNLVSFPLTFLHFSAVTCSPGQTISQIGHWYPCVTPHRPIISSQTYKPITKFIVLLLKLLFLHIEFIVSDFKTVLFFFFVNTNMFVCVSIRVFFFVSKILLTFVKVLCFIFILVWIGCVVHCIQSPFYCLPIISLYWLRSVFG